jgi:hypothetical protein
MRWRGTSSMLAKNRALSWRVCSVSVVTRVRDPSEDPGSLNPLSVGAHAEQLHVDWPRLHDRRVVGVRGSEDVLGHPIGAVHPDGVDVDVVGELRPDDVRVGLWVTRRQAHVLVQQERLHRREAQTLVTVSADQLPVHRQRRRSRRQPKVVAPDRTARSKTSATVTPHTASSDLVMTSIVRFLLGL